MNFKKFLNNAFFTLAGFAALGVVSCKDNIGLGSSVDTEPPTIEITYPPASAVVRGEFVLSGKWKDDKGVAVVNASIMNVTTGQSYPANAVTLEENNGWSVRVNNYDKENADYVNGWQLPDGKYELSVVATDRSGHKSGSATRAFEIDNTAPVVVLRSPGSTENATKYGSSFSVSGIIAEEHTVSSLSVTMYDENGTVLDSTDTEPYTETSVPTAGGTEIALLRFAAEPTTVQQKRYESVYGTDRNAGTKVYSCSIRVADNAKEYTDPTQTTNETVGNETAEFYLYGDVYKKLMSRENGGYGLSAADLMTIINGTYVATDASRAAGVLVGELTEEQVQTVRGMLVGEESLAVDTKKDALKFSLNPKVNPTYTAGLILKDTPSGFKTAPVNYKVQPGLDGTLIEPATIKVWLLNCGKVQKDETGAYVWDSSKYEEFLANPASFEGNPDVEKVADLSEEDATPVESFDSTFNLPKLVANNWYVIAISGYDADGNELVPSDVFGFVGALSGTPPQVKVISPSSQSIVSTSDNIVIKGETVTKELELARLEITTEVSDVESGEIKGIMIAYGAGEETDAVTWEEPQFDEVEMTYTYKWTCRLEKSDGYAELSAQKGSGRIYSYAATVTATDASGNSAKTNCSVTADTVPPQVKITSVIPSVTDYTDETHTDAEQAYVNGKITISGSVTETNLKSATYTVFVDGEAVEDLTDMGIKSPASFSIEIDTTKLPDDKPINVVVTAEDRADSGLATGVDGSQGKGNVGTYSTTELNNGKAYHILQETDRPVISLTNADAKINEVADIKNAVNNEAERTNIFAKNGKLTAIVTDDDGVASVDVSYRALGSNGKSDASGEFKRLSSSYSFSNNVLSVTPPAEYGGYEVKIVVIDKVGTLSTSFITLENLAIAIDDDVPAFESVQPANGIYYKEESAFPVSGIIKDASGSITLKLKDADNGTSAEYGVDGVLLSGEGSIKFNDTVTTPKDSKNYELTYVAIDRYGQSSECTIRYIVDAVSPETKGIPACEQEASASGYLGTNSPTIVVYAKDNKDGSGIATVSALRDGADTSNAVTLVGQGTPDEEGFTKYTGTVTLPEGRNTVTVTIKDVAGNVTEKKTDTMKVDTIPPTMTSPTVLHSVINKATREGLSSGLRVSLTITDTGSGVKKAWLGKTSTVRDSAAACEEDYTNATIKAESNEAVTAESGWEPVLSIPQTDLGDGSHVYYVYAMDMAGRVSVSEPVTFTVDTTPPLIEVSGLKTGNTYTKENVFSINNAVSPRTAKYTVAGSWTDKNGDFAGTGTSELYYSRDNGSTWTKIDGVETAAGVTLSWMNTIDVTESLENTFWFKAKDVAGNETAQTDYVKFTGIKFDLSVPVITLSDETKAIAPNMKNDVTISATVQDALSLAESNIIVTITKDDEALTDDAISAAGIEKTITQAETGKNKPYSVSVKIPAKADHSNDGAWKVTVSATDDAGRAAEAKMVSSRIDTTAPTLGTLAFATDNGSAKDGVYYFNSTHTPAISLTATDAGTGIDSVMYAAVGGHTVTDISSVAESDLKVKWTKLQVSNTADTYTLNVTEFNTLSDGAYTVFARAKDALGNSAYTPAFKVYNDKTAPALEEIVNAEKPKDSTGKSYDSAVGNTFALNGTVTDAVALKSLLLSRTEDGTAKEAETITPVSGNAWKINQSVPADTDSHTYAYILTATDYAGNKTEITNRTVVIDRTAPVFTGVTLKDAPNLFTKAQNCTIEGTVTDEGGSQLKAVKIAFYAGDTPTADSACETVNVNSDGTFSHTFTNVQEGSYKVKLFATDNAANRGGSDNGIAFVVDRNAPASSLSATGTLQTKDPSSPEIQWGESVTYITGSTFTLRGSVTDTYGFGESDIKLYVGSEEKSFASVDPADFVWKNASSAYTWSYKQDVDSATHANDGTYTYRLVMTDKAGNTDEKKLIVQVDTTAPTVAITEPVANANMRNGSLTISGTALDAGTGPKTVTYTLSKISKEGTATPVSLGEESTLNVTDNQWKASFTLSDQSKYMLTVKASDYLGNASDANAKSVVFYYDETAPSIADNIVVSGTKADGKEYYQNGTISLTMNVTDAISKISSVYYTVDDKSILNLINGDEVDERGEGTYKPTINLTDGTHTIYLYASDEYGNEIKKTEAKKVTVKIDSTAPTFGAIAAETPSSGDITVSTSAQDNIALTASGVTMKIAKGGVTLSDSEIETAGITKTVTQTETGNDKPYTVSVKIPATVDHSNDGAWKVTLLAADDAGNETSVAKDLVIDTTAPELGTLAFATDNGSAKDGVYYFNGSDIPVLNLTATDAGTGINSVKYTSVSGHYDDWDSVPENIRENITDTTVQLASGNTYRLNVTEFNTLSEGEYTVFVRVEDMVGNLAHTDALKVYNDKTSPTLTETVASDKPKDSSGKSYDNAAGNKFALNGTVADAVALKSLVLSRTEDGTAKDAETITPASGDEWQIQQGVPADTESHTYGYTLTATDYAGNQTEIAGRTVEIDRTDPVFGATITLNGETDYFTNSQNCTIGGSVSDVGSGLNKVRILCYKGTDAPEDENDSRYDDVDVDSSGKFAYKFPDMEEGTYTLSLFAKDKADNRGEPSATVTFKVDRNAPASTLSSTGTLMTKNESTHSSEPATGLEWGDNVTYITGSEFTLSGKVTDTYGFDASEVKLLIDSETTPVTFTTATEDFAWADEESGFEWSYKQTVDAEGHTDDGIHTYRLTMKDRAGNKDTKTFIVQIDTIAPTATITTPAASVNYEGSVTVSGTALDGTGTGAKNVAYALVKLDKDNREVADSKVTGTVNVTNNQWTDTLTLSDQSKYKLTITPEDYVANTIAANAKSVVFYYDKTAPAISNVAAAGVHDNEDYFKTGTLTLTASVTDSIADVSSVYYMVDENETKKIMSPNTSGKYEGEINLADGDHTIYIYANDAHNNLTKDNEIKELRVTIDTTAPSFGEVEAETPSKNDITVSTSAQDAIALSASGVTRKIEKDGATLSDSEIETAGITNTVTQDVAGKDKPYTVSVAIPAKNDNSNDGTWKVTLVATDDAGNKTSVTKDVVIDTTAPTTGITGFATTNGSAKDDVYYFNGKDIPLLDATAQDDGSTVAGVSYGIVSGTETAWNDSLVLVNTNESGSWANVQFDSGSAYRVSVTDFATLNEGAYTVFVRAIDAVGNPAYSAGFPVYNDKTAPALEEIVDSDKPKDSSGKSYDSAKPGNEFTLNGTVSDTIALKSLVLSRTEDSIAKDAETITPASGNAWVINQNVPNDDVSHTYKYTLTATDYAGNKTEIIDRTVEIDRTAPAFEGEITLNGGTDYFTNSQNCTISDSVKDNVGGSGLNVVRILYYEYGTTAPSENDNGYKDVDVGSDGKFEYKFSDVPEGTWTLSLFAKDKADNKGVPSATVTFKVDRNAPASTLSSTGTLMTKNESTHSSAAATISEAMWGDNVTYITGSEFTLSGKVTDKFGFDASKVQLLIDSSATPVAFTTSTANFEWQNAGSEFAWSYTQTANATTHADDGIHTYRLTMEDNAGNKDTKTFIVQIDTTAPTAKITTPANGTNHNGAVTVAGMALDGNGTGAKNVTYSLVKLDKQGNPTAIESETNKALDVTDNQWTHTFTLSDQSKYRLTVTPKDYLDKSGADETIEFYYDKTAPNVSDVATTATPAEGYTYYSSGTFTLSAAVSDDISTVSTVAYTLDDKADKKIISLNETTGKYQDSISLADGYHKIKVYATDAHANETAGTETGVYIDTTAPVFSAIEATKEQSAAAIVFSGKLTENIGLLKNGDDGEGNATQKLTITATKGGETVALPEGLTVPSFAAGSSLTNQTFSFTLPAPADTHANDGEWKFTLQVTDQAGNVATAETTPVKIDTTKPEVGTTAFTTDQGSANGGIYYFNSSHTPVVSVSASDGGTGVKDVYFAAVSGHTITDITTVAETDLKVKWTKLQVGDAANSYTHSVREFNSLDEGEYTVFVRVADAVGNTAYSGGIKVYNDRTIPTLTETSDDEHPVVDGKSFVSEDFTLNGTASDTVAFKSLVLTFKLDNSVQPVNEEGNNYSPKLTKTDNAWTVSQKVDTSATHTYEYAWTATDYAGNEKTISGRTVQIDKDAPTVTVDTLNRRVEGGNPVFDTTNSTCVFEGTIKDNTNGSGVYTAKALYYKVGETAPADNAEGYTDISIANSGKYTLTFSDVQEGRYILKIVATDYAHNSGYIAGMLNFTVDSEAPKSTLTLPANTIYYGTKDTVVGTDGTYTVDTVQKQAKWNDGLTYLAKAEFTLSGTVTDAFAFTKDGIKLYDASGNALTFTTDENVTTAADGSTSLNWSYKQSVAANGSDDGSHTYRLETTDAAGNKATYAFIVYVDTKAPSATILTPAPSANITTDTLKISGTAFDEGTGIESVTYTITKVGETDKKEGDATLTNGKWEANVEGLSEGNLAMTVQTKDKLGHTSEAAEVSFVYDSTPPEITVSENPITETKTTDGYYDSRLLTLTVEATDLTSGVGNVTYKVEGGTEKAMTRKTDEQGKETNFYEASVVFTKDGLNTVYVYAQDTMSNKTKEADKKSYEVNIDTTAPAFSAITVTGMSNDTLNASNTDVTFSGTITEAQGLATTGGFVITATKDGVALTSAQLENILKKNGTTTISAPDTKTPLNDNEAEFSFTLPAVVANDGKWVFTVAAKDVAENTATVTTATVLIDTTEPKWTEDKVGETTYTFKVGGKAWTENNWYKDSALSVEGYFAETGSGIKDVAYTITRPSSSEPVSGTISPSSSTGYVRFVGELSSLENGSTIKFTATDEAGNSADSSAFGIKIDSAAPTVTEVEKTVDGKDNPEYSAFDSIVVINGKNDKDLYFYAADDTGTSGVDTTSISASIGNTAVTGAAITTTEVEGSTGKYKVKLTLPKASLSGLSGYQPVTVTVKDIAGNSLSQGLGTLNIDSKEPEVTITSHSAGNVVNKTVKVSGKATDSSGIVSITLEASYNGKKKTYTYPASDGAAGTITYTNGSDWSVDINTSDYTATTATSLAIAVKATDKALNESIEYASGNTAGKTPNKLTLSLDQNSDRPVVSLMNLKSNGGTLTAGTINGMVSDDDGQIEATNFSVGEDELNESGVATGEVTWYASTSDNLTYNGGSWAFTLPDASLDKQGEKKLYFKITDAAGTEFVHTKETDLEKPYVRGNTYGKEGAVQPKDEATYLTYTLDTNPPEILEYKVQFTGEESVTLTNGMVFGKEKPAFTLTVKAKDTSGIKTISAQFGSLETVTEEINSTTADEQTAVLNMTVPTAATYSGQSVDIKITVTDQNGAVAQLTRNVTVDNVAPTMAKFKPVKDTQVIGETEISGSTHDGEGGTGVVRFGYYIPTNEDGWSTLTDAAKIAKFTIISDDEGNNTTAWGIKFTSEEGAAGSLAQFFSKTTSGETVTWHNWKEADKESQSPTYGTELTDDDGNGTQIWSLPIYFYMEDKAGNYTIDTSYALNVNPDGDRPTAEISYPAETDYDNYDDKTKTSAGYITLGGMIRVFGSAHDNDSVKQVQIHIQKAEYGSAGEIIRNDFKDVSGYTNKPVSGTSNWSYTINGTDGQFGAPGTFVDVKINESGAAGKDGKDDTKGWADTVEYFHKSLIRVRARAVDNKDLVGSWSGWVYVMVDKSAPRIGSTNPIRLVQFADNAAGTGAITATKDYESGMYISGTWWLTCSVEDESGIKSVSVSGDEVTGEGASVGTLSVTTGTHGSVSTGMTGYSAIKIPLKTSGTGAVKFNISAEDLSNPTQTSAASVYVRFDNEAPAQTSLLNGATEIGTGENEAKVTQSNYAYTINSSVTESGSGLKQVAVYFKRGTSIYDPRFAPTDDANTITGYTVSGGLPTKTYEGVTRSGEDNFTLTAADTFITKGSLVKIAGLYRLVTGVDGTTYTFSPAASTENKTVEVVYALIVDNTKVETTTVDASGRLKVTGAEDGDGIYDSVTEETGGTYTWKMMFDSTNIPDGPITICSVAFDEAGNVSAIKETTTDVSNNAPRIAKVYLGTDLSGDDTISSDETFEYSMLESDPTYGYHEAVANAEIDAINTTKTFVAKAKTEMSAEIIGGNGALKYQWDAYTGANFATKTKSQALTALTTTASTVTMKEKGYVSTGDSGVRTIAKDEAAVATKKATVTHTVSTTTTNGTSTTTLDGIPDGAVKIVYKFWDSTDGTTAGTDSQYATVTAAFTVDVVDDVSPTAIIDPFYWEGKDKNSLFGNDTANGHIELEKDLPTATFTDDNKGVEGKEEYDRDPKVSGKISIRGSAYDNTRLTALYAHIDDFTFSEKVDNVEQIANAAEFGFKHDGTATNATGASTAENPPSITYYKLATYNAGDWTGTGSDELPNGWKFEVTKNTLGQEGHFVEWQLDFDTSKITNVAGLDKNVRIIAVDARASVGNASSESVVTKDGTTTNKPSYQMDVVPYVSKVYTNLAKNKVSNWSVYNRTALGHYPVQSVVSNIASSITLKTNTSEDVTLYGFNLNDSSATIVSGSKTFTVGNNTAALKIDNSTSGQLKFNVASLSSGELDLTVNGLSILNNKNNNDADGSASAAGESYANWYNRQGNGDTNNILTDDVEFDVWEFNDRAATPINGLAAGINMEINQKTGMLNYAFANGGLYYSMGGNINRTVAYDTTNSYSSYYWAADWDTFAGPCVGFHVDELGYTYSVDSGGDTNSSGSVDKWVLYTSRWGLGTRDTGGTLGGDASLRLEEIALKTGSDNFAYSLMKYRFLSPEFASSVSDNNTNLYLVYYDALTNQIRFRAGTFSGTDRQTTGGFQDQYTSGTSSYYSTSNCQVIANGEADPFKTRTGDVTVPLISGRGAGQYVDVAVVKNAQSKDVVCVVWYDGEDNCLKFSYITDPIANWNSLKGNATAANWSKPVTVFAEGGEYCHIVADKDNHLHIAAYAGNGDVMYAYLAAPTESEADVQSCVVDASGAVGEHLTLDVAVNSKGHSIPYIGYYTSAIKMPKYATLVDPTATDTTATFENAPAGVDSNERFTGAWEVTVIPSPSRMTTNREDKVNIGVWKNAGVLTDSKINNAVQNSSKGGTMGNNGYNSTNWSKTFGNGTANAVLGYQISTSSGSCLETAQMR